jgi:hypothetical protein
MKSVTTFLASATIAFMALANQGFAQGVKPAYQECEIITAAKCMCPASMEVRCGDITGQIDDNEPVKSVKIAYRTDDGRTGSFVLDNPRGSARDYYNPSDMEEVKTALLRKGINPDQATVFGRSITISGSATLYKDPYKREPITAGGDQNVGNVCSWAETPSVISTKGCGTPICVGRVLCNGQRGFAGCKAKPDGKSCGTAQACIEDQDVTFGKQPVRFDGPINGDGSTNTGRGN